MSVYLLCGTSYTLGSCFGMSAQSFIRCFKRFTARRGVPVRIISDNGTTFKSAAKILGKMISHPEVQGYFAGMHIQLGEGTMVGWDF